MENYGMEKDEDTYDEVFMDDSEAKARMEANTKPKKQKVTSKKLVVVVCILLTEMCERLTFYSVGANTVLFGTSVLKYSSTDAAHVANIFTGRQ